MTVVTTPVPHTFGQRDVSALLPYPWDVDERRRFDFAIDPRFARVLRLFGVQPARAWARIDPDSLIVRFGFWRFSTELANVDRVRITGPYPSALRAIGAHISLADRGLSFCSTTDLGACVLFRTPVPSRETLGLVRHPGLTVTPQDPRAFADALTAARDRAQGQAHP